MEQIKYLFGLQNLTKVIPNNDSNSKIEVLEKKKFFTDNEIQDSAKIAKAFINCKYILVVDSEGKGGFDGKEKVMPVGNLVVNLINALNLDVPYHCKLINNIEIDSQYLDMEFEIKKGNITYGISLEDELNPEVDTEIGCSLNQQFYNLSFIFNPRNSKEIQICEGIKWLGQSIVEADIKIAFVKVMIALECVAEVNPNNAYMNPSITYQIATMLSLVNGYDYKSRKEIVEKIKTIYGKRSIVFHGNAAKKQKIGIEDVKYVQRMVQQFIFNVIQSQELNKYDSIQDIWKYINTKILKQWQK